MNRKRIIAALFAVLVIAVILSGIWYFIPKTFLGGIEASKVGSITVFDGNTGKEFTIEQPEEIGQIVENIRAAEMKRDQISLGYSGYGFRMSFTDEKGKIIDHFIINSPGTIRDDPFFYRCDDSLCFEFLKELEEKYAGSGENGER